ncbi:MAG: carboxymuconolactone decarboxylase family protein [Actinobacteria bacterium]|nr:carboxymuconolactone decarboxylase family protein [Actinomycetota bacterium]
MTEPRIPMLDPDATRVAAEEAGIPTTHLNVFRVLLNHPHLARSLYRLLATLLWHGQLDARLRELVIMRIGWRTGSVYEWTQHWQIARDLGVTEEDLLAVRDFPDDGRFGPAERAVLTATDETLDAGAISRATWQECAAHLPMEHLLELVVAIGNWRMFSSLLRSLEVPLENGVDPWPPDGKASKAP